MKALTRQRIALLLNIALAAPLLIYAFATIYTRFMGDDFCAYDQVYGWGIAGYVILNYMLWSGRLVHNTSAALLRYVTPQAQAWLAVGFLALWWFALFLLIAQLLRKRDVPHTTLWSAAGASLLLLTTLTGSANIIHTIYWQSAIVTYLMPLVLLTFFAWAVLQDRLNGALSLALCALLPLIAAGYSEVYALMQTLLIAVAYFVYRGQRPQIQRLLVGFACSFLMMLVVVLAPGNSVRQSSSYPTPNLMDTIKNTLISPAIPVIVSAELTPLNFIALLVLPAMIAYYEDKRWDRQEARQARTYLLLALVTSLGCSAAAFGVGYYALSNVLPARVLMEPQYFVLCSVALSSYLAGLALRTGRQPVLRRPVGALAIVLLLAAMLMSSFQASAVVQRLQPFAAAWDQRDAEIKAARTAQPNSTEPINVTYIPDRFDVDEIGPDTSTWINQCAATYYHVAAIVAHPPQ